MKKITKSLAVLLVAVIALLSFSITAGATEVSNTQDGLVASITSEKDSYKANEDIELTFKVTNTNDFAVENVSLEAIIPDGLTLKNNADTTVNTVSLGSGESLELSLALVEDTVTAVLEPTSLVAEPASQVNQNTDTTSEINQKTALTAKNTGNGKSSDNTVATGNNMSYLFVALICLVCLVVVILALKFRKKTVKYISLVLCLCISVGSVAVVGIPNTSAEETTQQMSFEVSKTITVDSLNYELKSVISYSVTMEKDNGSLSASVISSDNTPLPDVRVDAYLKVESGIQYVGNTYTDDKGNFSMALQDGSYEIRFNKDGYKSTVETIKISKNTMTFLEEPIIMEKENNSNIFEQLPEEFIFSSGAGGWKTTININDDGTFEGKFIDSAPADTGSNYPIGTVYIREFSGKFTNPEQIDEYTYSMNLESSLELIGGANKEEYYKNGIRYVYSDPYGFDSADEFLIYLPGKKMAELPEEFISWLPSNRTAEALMYYGIYNIGGKQGFYANNEY